MTSAQQVELTSPGLHGGGGGAGPFQRAVQLHFGAGADEVTATVAVPAGLHLVIETVTADIGVGDQEQPFLFVTTAVQGVPAQHTIALHELPRMANVFVATRPVRLYADPGSTITVMITRFGGGSRPAIPKPQLVTLSGSTTP